MIKRILLATSLVLGIGLFGSSAVYAYEMVGGEQASIGADRTVDGPAYAAGSNVSVAGTINGDLYCAGQTVEITATVNGDIICAAQQIKISGPVSGDVRVAAQTFNIESNIAGSLTAFAQNVELAKIGQVGKDATVFGQTVRFDGSIGRDLIGGASSMLVNGSIGGSVELTVQMLSLGSTAVVSGTLNYTSPREASIAQGATTGQVSRQEPADQQHNAAMSPLASFAGFAFYWFLAMLLVGIVMVFLAPGMLESAALAIRNRAWVVVSWGVVWLFVLPLVGVVIAISVIGIPLALILFLAWLLALALSSVFSAYAIGRLIIGRNKNQHASGWMRFGYLALGLAILGLLSIIPFINILISLLVMIFGAGGLLYALRSRASNSTLPAR